VGKDGRKARRAFKVVYLKGEKEGDQATGHWPGVKEGREQIFSKGPKGGRAQNGLMASHIKMQYRKEKASCSQWKKGGTLFSWRLFCWGRGKGNGEGHSMVGKCRQARRLVCRRSEEEEEEGGEPAVLKISAALRRRIWVDDHSAHPPDQGEKIYRGTGMGRKGTR